MSWKTTKEVALTHGKHEKTVRRWCRWGWVRARPQPSGRGWLVEVDANGLALPR